MNELKESSVTHGHLGPVQHPELGVTVNGQSAVRYLRFLRPARLDRLELRRSVYGRWMPNVPTHPAHLILGRRGQTAKRENRN